jgi:hypothetical protein
LFSLKGRVSAGVQEGLDVLCQNMAEETLFMLPAELSVLCNDDGEREYYFELDQEICDK